MTRIGGHAILWLLPALVLTIAFLVIPAAQTVRLSLFETPRLSESELRKALAHSLSKPGKPPVRSSSPLEEHPGWPEAVHDVSRSLGIASPPLLDPRLSIREAAEALWIAADTGARSRVFSGTRNYHKLASDPAIRTALANNALWIVLFTTACMALGLLFAFLFENVRWGPVAKTLVFLPMAISFVAAGVIWSFMYEKSPETGTVNALANLFVPDSVGWEPVAFLGNPDTVNVALVAAGVWMWTGFSAVLLQAALRNVPPTLLEAAALDGATRWQIFFRVELPLIMPTVLVVATTLLINVLKVFDIVYTMTAGGPYGSSEVLANRMYQVAFQEGNFEYSSAIAVVIMLAVTPVLAWNLWSWWRTAALRGRS